MSGHLGEVLIERRGRIGCITLNRPRALNALDLPMIRTLTACLSAWRDDPAIGAVAIRGSSAAGPFGAFCAGGDIRHFHQAALQGDPSMEDFFTEEYALDHLIHAYPKPYLAFMDGVVMGGGMGISQGASQRLVTARTVMAMPETAIGLFPDVGGGYFLSRCPGHAGEWLALTGRALDAAEAIALGLADHALDAERLQPAWDALAALDPSDPAQLAGWLAAWRVEAAAPRLPSPDWIDRHFSLPGVADIVRSLEAEPSEPAQQTAATLRQRSPLMLHVTLEQLRRARRMTLAEDLRMERALMRHVFFTRHLQRFGAATEAVEGIRALVVDKDKAPRWNPPRIEDVTPAMVEPFFASPWPAASHPLRSLA